MTTKELIDIAREYAEEYGHDSEGGITIPFPRDKLLELADRLEITEELLKTFTNPTETYGTECSTCKYNYVVDKYNEQPCLNCDFLVEGSDNYVSRGDTE